jgi:hypothetical protein
MQNAECRTKNEERAVGFLSSSFCILRSAFCVHLRTSSSSRHQPTDDEESAADAEQADFERDVVLKEADRQADGQHDHSDELKKTPEKNRHQLSVRRTLASLAAVG